MSKTVQSITIAVCIILFILLALNSCAPKGETNANVPDSTAQRSLDALLAENEELRDHLCYFLDNPDGRGVHLKKMTRGFRNKNPMNVAALGSRSPWLGQIGKDDQGLARFASWEHGLRAGYKTLKAYQHRHKVDTLFALASRYCEGDALRYARHIGRSIGVGPYDKVDISAHIVPIMKAIIVMENGYNPFPEEYFIAYM